MGSKKGNTPFPIKHTRGFTLVELLVVIGIIGVLATISVAALSAARARARDIRRVTDIQQIQKGLFLYQMSPSVYPITGPDVTFLLGTVGENPFRVLCDTAQGFEQNESGCGATYINPLPSDPSSPKYDYKYASTDGTTYTIFFTLEAGAASLGSGPHSATPEGLQ